MLETLPPLARGREDARVLEKSLTRPSIEDLRGGALGL
jgi:hypothetical protein